ncbi:MAG: hypothetical protein U0893_02345 [Chloroflexota bacterium]
MNRPTTAPDTTPPAASSRSAVRADLARTADRPVSATARADDTTARPPAPAPGASGDPWLPLPFLVTGLGAMLLLALVYPWHLDLLRGSFYDTHLLAFVHVNTLGVVGAVIFGASYQMLPIVLQTPLAAPGIARLSRWLYVPGLIAFVVGLGHGETVMLGIGGSLIFGAVLLYVWSIARTLAVAPHRDVTWWHVAAATTALATGATLGLLLALSKQVGFLAGLTFPILAAHVVLMLGGWVTPLLTGVAYRLVSMFTITEDRIRPGRAACALGLTAGGAWLLAVSLLAGLGWFGRVAGATSLLAGLVLFASQIVDLYRHRLRRSSDVHVPFMLVSLASGLSATALLAWGLAAGRGPADPLWIVVGWLAIVGWAQTAIQGFLYKIGPFLTWLHRYGALAGVQRVPMLEDLYSAWLARFGWAAWTAGLVLGAICPLTTVEWLPVAAAVALSLGGVAVIANGARVGSHWLR